MAPTDHRLDLIRLRAKRVARCEKSLKYTREAYTEAINNVASSLAEYELEELSPDQEPAAVLTEIRRLAERRGALDRRKALDLEARKDDLAGARKRLEASIFDDQLELFVALDEDRKAIELAEPIRLKVDGVTGALVPYLDEPEPAAKPRRGRAKA